MPATKRVQTAALRGLLLLCVCAFLGRLYIVKHSQAPIDIQRQEVDAVLDHATAQKGRTISTSHGAATGTRTQYTAALPPNSPSENHPERPSTSAPTATPHGDPDLLDRVPRYLRAIMDPSDTVFPRLSCPGPIHTRYDYLRATASTPSVVKYFFALDLYSCAPLLPRLLGTIVETIRFLGPSHCALSLVEGRSHDGTHEILHSLTAALIALNTTYTLTTNAIDPKAGAGIDRVEALAVLRNQALHPLTSAPASFDPDTTILFINDVALCMEDILELIHQRLVQKADMTCAMDWIYGGSSFYDVWVSRAMNGDQFFEIPQSGSWEFNSNLFWNHPRSRQAWEAKTPFQVYACWNGATAFTARPLLEQKVTFRTAHGGRGGDEECYMGEPTLFCKDMWHAGFGKIAVVPSVNVGYDDEESTKVKQVHGRTGDWVEREKEMRRGNDVDALIEWETEPPPVVKCVPTYEKPLWVPWDQALKKTARA